MTSLLRRMFSLIALSFALSPALTLAGTVPGTLAWSGVARLSLPVSGVIQEIPVVAGQTVAKGALLLRLDPTPFNARLAGSQAQRAGLARAAAEAKRDAERAQQLFDRTVASESEVQTALIAQEKAAAALAHNQAQTQLRQWELGQSVLKAPFPARVLRVQTTPGETISAELAPSPLITLARTDQIDVTAEVPPAEAAGLNLGQTLRVRVGNDPVEGKLTAISSHSEANTIHYQLRITLPAKPGWVAGLPTEIELP